MKRVEIIYENQEPRKDLVYDVERETKNFVWAIKNSSTLIKVSKKTNRSWIIKPNYEYESAKVSYLNILKDGEKALFEKKKLNW